jgi:hypothetical protein
LIDPSRLAGIDSRFVSCSLPGGVLTDDQHLLDGVLPFSISKNFSPLRKLTLAENMTKYLVRKIVSLAICLAALIVGYNYFWGNKEEQQNAKDIIAQVKGLTGSVVDLLSTEKDKYENGKYDNALVKVKETFAIIRDKATAMGESGSEILDKLGALEQHEQDLRKKLATLDGSESAAADNGSDSPGKSDSDRDQQAEVIRRQILSLNDQAHVLSGSLDNSN